MRCNPASIQVKAKVEVEIEVENQCTSSS